MITVTNDTSHDLRTPLSTYFPSLTQQKDQHNALIL